MQNLVSRVAKHVRLQVQNLGVPDVPSPPFLILFINSICNMKCEHCFYWRQLNSPDDLTFDELVKLSNELGPIENLNLSGGEPFLRKEFGAICRQFIRCNGVKEIYVPSNGYYTEKTITQIRESLKEPGLRLFATLAVVAPTGGAGRELVRRPRARAGPVCRQDALPPTRCRLHADSGARRFRAQLP